MLNECLNTVRKYNHAARDKWLLTNPPALIIFASATQFHVCGVNIHSAYCPNSVLNVLNEVKALVGAFSVIVKSLRQFVAI